MTEGDSLLDSKELVEAFKSYFDNFEYHNKRVEAMIKEWKEVDD